MGLLHMTQKILNDLNNKKPQKQKSPKLKPQKVDEKLSPRMNRIRSMDNFMKFQWSWTL
tara:strand:+ start:63 stop:239 length:177 start_codon:yes stop_codon:yes gene_type:complete